LLTRDFIAQSLYSTDGYFTKEVIHDLNEPLDFRGMLGKWHYKLALKKAYDSKPLAWMTPVEIFAPHFSNAVASYIAQEAEKHVVHDSSTGLVKVETKNLILFEIGGGTGTNALHVLNWLRDCVPHLYQRVEYTIVEISAQLSNKQKQRVCSVHNNCRVVNADMLEWGLSGPVEHRPCFVMGFEVLDNLPHDKVAWTGSVDADSGVPELFEAVVFEDGNGDYTEELRPLQDSLISEVLDLCPDIVAAIVPNPATLSPRNRQKVRHSSTLLQTAMAGLQALMGVIPQDHQAAFVPTGTLQLLTALNRKMPRHHIILADYDSFPLPTFTGAIGNSGNGGDESLVAQHAPLVSGRDPITPTNIIDFNTYMVPMGSADIYFPTDFNRLARMHTAVCGGKQVGNAKTVASIDASTAMPRVMKQGEFLREYGETLATQTLTGYNPLIEDFANASVFLGSS
ncbi:unnamed protein product, partial [Choristocarpus tenellus]